MHETQAVWRRNLYILWGIEFAAFTGLALILPFIPLYVRELGITDLAEVTKWSGRLLAAPFLLAFIATPIWASFGDRYGQKPMVIRALVGSSCCYLGMAMSGSVGGLLGWRLALGSVSGFLAAGMALVSVTVPDGQRGYALGLLQSVVPASGLLGPMLGGFLADWIGFREIFFVVAAVTATSSIIAWRTLVEPRHDTVTTLSERASVRETLRVAWRHPGLRAALLAIVCSQMLATTLQPIFVLFVEQLGVETARLSTATGVLYAATGISALIAAPAWGRWADRVGIRRTSTIAMTGSAVLLATQGAVTQVWQLFVLRLAFGCFVSGTLPPLLGFISNNSPSDRRGGLMGFCSSAAMLGNLMGPLLGGYLAAHFGLRSVFYVSAFGLLGVCSVLRRSVA